MSMQDPAPPTSGDVGSAKIRLLTSPRVKAAGLALGGMIVGSLVGIAVQVGVESTGALGPSVEQLIAEQDANFADFRALLQSLRQEATDPAVIEGLDELEQLLERQQALHETARGELASLGAQMANLREQALDERGVAGGANLWLARGESVNVGDARHVFGVNRLYRNVVDINLNGETTRMSVGDFVSVDSARGNCQVFFRQVTPRDDGRVGFDVVCG